MKSLSVTFSVDATRPPTLIDAPWPNRMPFGFTRKTLPLAVRLPRMFEGSDPSTRFKATELAVGCTNFTDSPAAMLKLSQLMAAFCVVCVISVLPAPLLMVALPAVTTPPAGAAKAVPPNDSISDTASALSSKRAVEPPARFVPEAFLPAVLAFSEAAT